MRQRAEGGSELSNAREATAELRRGGYARPGLSAAFLRLVDLQT